MTHSPANTRYHLIKNYKKKAFIFYQKAQTVEEKKAWLEVMNWFNTILKETRITTKSGAIGLKEFEPLDCLLGEQSLTDKFISKPHSK